MQGIYSHEILYSQMEGIYFHGILFPVIRIVSVCILFTLVSLLDLNLKQLYVKTTFLHRYLNDDIYMEKP